MPTLVDGEVVVYESIAILAYLDRGYPSSPLFGATPEDVATVWCVISEYTSYVDHSVEAFMIVNELRDGRSNVLAAGQGYVVADGDGAHRSKSTHGARLFIVD